MDAPYCQECYAFVVSVGSHQNWHSKIKRQIEAAEKVAKEALEEARRAKRASRD